MGLELEIKRYSAYYRGWCLAFGEHEITFEEHRGVSWAFGKSQIGFVVSQQLKRRLFRELLGHHGEIPLVALSEQGIRINTLDYTFTAEEQQDAHRFIDFIKKNINLHMFLTSHFCYPSGTRIITFSPKKPTTIMYKEIPPLSLTIL